MFSLMQRSEVHSNASELTTRDHQIRMIYSPVLAYTVSSVEWSRNNKAEAQSGWLTERWRQGNRFLIAFSYCIWSKTESIYRRKCLKMPPNYTYVTWCYSKAETLQSTSAVITLELLLLKPKLLILKWLQCDVCSHVCFCHIRLIFSRVWRVRNHRNGFIQFLQPHSSTSSCCADVTHFNFQSPQPNQRIALLFCLSGVGPIDDQHLHM